MQSISDMCSYIPNHLPSNLTAEDTVNALGSQAKRMVQNINRAAIPIMILTAAMIIPQAEAGPFAYGVCVTVCGLAAPPAIPLCVQGCLGLLLTPTP